VSVLDPNKWQGQPCYDSDEVVNTIIIYINISSSSSAARGLKVNEHFIKFQLIAAFIVVLVA